MHPSLCNLPRFPLSVIASYLQQSSEPTVNNGAAPSLPHNRDALSLLLTNKRFAYAILPLFRVPRQRCRNYRYQTTEGTPIIIVERYRFVTLPIQDPRTLLDRLNTRRLRGRIVLVKRERGKERDLRECKEDETEANIAIDCSRLAISTDDTDEKGNARHCYRLGRTIEELAYEEWTLMRINHDDSSVRNGDEKNMEWKTWPAHLELLRFLEDGPESKQSSSGNGSAQKERRRIPTPFCFRPRQKGDVECAPTNDIYDDHLFGNGVSLLASYPRSGNTLLRTLLEKITSIATGSDTRPDRTLSRSLAMDHDLVGEGLVGPSERPTTKAKSYLHNQHLYQSAYDPLVHVVKTHFPERKGWKPVKGSRVLLLVRNPYDAIDSYWNLCCTNTHTRTLEESVYAQYAEKFEGLARHEIEIWLEFHYYWIDVCEKEGVPLLVVRYEDLVLDTESEMLRVMSFLTCGADADSKLTTSFWKWRIRHAVGKSQATSQATASTSNLGSYQPRSSAGGLLSIGKSIRKGRYSESILSHMHEVAATLALTRKQSSSGPFLSQQSKHVTLLQQFGYDIDNQQFPNNFKQPPAVPSFGNGKKRGGAVVINKSLEIRPADDPYGRAMTFWRRGQTDGDTNPFPTVPR